MTIFNNMAFGLQLAKKKKDFIQETVTRTSQALGPIRCWNGSHKLFPVVSANGLLSDEPSCEIRWFSYSMSRSPTWMLRCVSRCDRKYRGLHGQLGSTMIYVTHDQVEAMTMGDRICVMKDGVIMQVADPLTLYRKPENCSWPALLEALR